MSDLVERARSLTAKPWFASAVSGAFLMCVVAMYGVAALPDGMRGRAYAAVSTWASLAMLLAWAVPVDARRVQHLVRVGFLARFALLAVPTFTSHDAVRYIWDGAATLAGYDPYFYSPQGIRAALPLWTVPTDNAGYVTLYPPLALCLFVLSALAGPSAAPWLWRVLVFGASAATLLVGSRSLARCGCERHAALLAFSPPLVFEAGVGLHVDVFAALAVACALLAFGANRPARAAACLALGALVKLTPVLALVPLWIGARGRSKATMVVTSIGVVGAGYGTAILIGLRPLGSLGEFVTEWRFGSPVFALLEGALHTPLALRASAIIAILVLATGVLVALRGDVISGASIALVAPLVASPVMFPWYLMAQAVVLAHRPRAIWIAWAMAMPLTYEVLDRFDRGEGWAGGGRVLIYIAIAVVAGGVVDGVALRRGIRRRVSAVGAGASESSVPTKG